MLGQILTKANQVYAIPTHVARSFLKPVAADSLSDQIFGAAPVACKDRHFLAPAPFVDLEQSLGRHDCDERRARSPFGYNACAFAIPKSLRSSSRSTTFPCGLGLCKAFRIPARRKSRAGNPDKETGGRCGLRGATKRRSPSA